MSWLKKETVPTGKVLDDGTPEMKTIITGVLPRTSDRRKGESRSQRVRRNAAELAMEAGIEVSDAAARLRAGDPLGQSKN